MQIKPIYEFVLWDNCSGNCKFCWQKKNYNFQNIEQRIKSLDVTINFLQSSRFEKGSHVLVVGGELFDEKSLNVSKKIEDVFDQLTDMQKKEEIDLLYVNTNLMYKNINLLCNVLQIIQKKKLLNRLRFTTSYDYYGRFNRNTEKIFFQNLDEIIKKYDGLNVVTNTIMTKQFCEKQLQSDKSFTKDFFDKHKSYVNLIPYIDVDNYLTPSAEDVFKVLRNEEDMNPGYLMKYIQNFDLPQEKIIYKSNDSELVFRTSNSAACGHGINFSKYSSRGTCFICDIKELFNV